MKKTNRKFNEDTGVEPSEPFMSGIYTAIAAVLITIFALFLVFVGLRVIFKF